MGGISRLGEFIASILPGCRKGVKKCWFQRYDRKFQRSLFPLDEALLMILFITASQYHFFEPTPSLIFFYLDGLSSQWSLFASLPHHIYLNLPMRSPAKKWNMTQSRSKKGLISLRRHNFLITVSRNHARKRGSSRHWMGVSGMHWGH